MEVRQIYEILNETTKEVLGKEDLVLEDLSNIIDVGNELFTATSVDNYVKSLVDHIGKVVFVNRVYGGSAPSILMDGWEFGSVLEKIQCDTPVATENESWELEDGKSYDENVFYKPSVSVKFYNDRVTFEVPISITDKQVKSAFSSREQLNSFMSMILNAVERSLTIKIDSLVRKTIVNFIGETLKTDEVTSETASTKSTARCVNLLKLYNDETGLKLTKAKALTDIAFLRYASKVMGMYTDRLRTLSSLFNIGGKDRFTDSGLLHTVLLSDFEKSVKSTLMSDTYHEEYVALPEHETIAFWQGSGVDYKYGSTSKINIKTSSGATIAMDGIVGVMFDRDALGVANMDKYVTSKYNAKAEFTNFWYKYFAGYFNDFNENFVVFFIA